MRRVHQTLILSGTDAVMRMKTPHAFSPMVVSSWEALVDAMSTASPASAVIADPYMSTGAGSGPSRDLERAILRHESVPVIAAMDLGTVSPADVSTVLRWGTSGLLDLRMRRSEAAVNEALRETRARPLKRRIEPLLGPCASHRAHQIVRAACEVAVMHGQSTELAGVLGADGRTVETWCREEGIPVPRRMLAWVRVLLASMMLREPGRTVIQVARAAGYSNDHAFRRILANLGVGRLASIGRSDLFPSVAEAFRRELRTEPRP